MTKSIAIWRNKLKISKENEFYMIYNPELDLFIHAKELKFGQSDINQGWLLMFNRGIYIGSVWINTNTDMKKIEKFLEETK